MSDPGQTVRGSGRHLFSPPPRSERAELLDEDVVDPEELAGNFRDIQRVNRLLGGSSVILRHVPTLLSTTSATEPVTILDLATGSGDIPLAISQWARRRNLPLRIVASDVSPAILELARKQTSGDPAITIAEYDARSVPLPDKAFDIVLCSLSLHHFSADNAIRVLRQMDRLARRGFILNDLRRGRIGYAAAWIASRRSGPAASRGGGLQAGGKERRRSAGRGSRAPAPLPPSGPRGRAPDLLVASAAGTL